MRHLARVLPLLLILAIFGCRQKQSPVAHSVENGVEVVVNNPGLDRSSPPRVFDLRKETVIDLSSPDIVRRGLTDPAAFDVDPAGNIVVWSRSPREALFFKFGPEGLFLSAFGRAGQGPGEVQSLTDAHFEASGELMAWDEAQSKMVFFDGNGIFVRQNIVSRRPFLIAPLGEGCYVTREQEPDAKERLTLWKVLVCGPDLVIKKEIGRGKAVWPGPGRKFPALPAQVLQAVSANYVFFGNGEAGYEIACFEKSGRPKRIIRKSYQPVPLSAEDRDGLAKLYEGFPPEFMAALAYPDAFPPYRMAFADEQDRLYVMTYEGSGEKGYYWYDVFGPDGVLAGRLSLGNYGTFPGGQGVLFAMARKGRIYHLAERPDGYKELVVWRMR
jgi:hypothetical protein